MRYAAPPKPIPREPLRRQVPNALDGLRPIGYERAVRRRVAWVGVGLLLVAGGLGFLQYLRWWEGRYDEVIAAAARRYQVDPALLKAVIWQESRFRADARGRAGELGLMQIRPPAAGEWAQAERVTPFAHAQLIDPGTNTLTGAWYLAKLLQRYRETDNPLSYALADYNAGRTHVLRWLLGSASTNSAAFLAQMDFPGTRRYVLAVSRRYDRYRELHSR